MKRVSIVLVLLFIAGFIFSGGGTETVTAPEKVLLSVAATQPPWITSIEDNRLTDLLEETFDFEFDFTIIPLEEAKQQVRLLIASGNYPSVFMNAPFVPADELEFGMEGGVLIPLNKYLTKERTPNILKAFDSEILKVELTDLKDDTLYALIHIKYKGKEMTIDARPSDAIGIALTVSAPIYVSEEVLSRAEEASSDQLERWLESFSLEDFKHRA